MLPRIDHCIFVLSVHKTGTTVVLGTLIILSFSVRAVLRKSLLSFLMNIDGRKFRRVSRETIIDTCRCVELSECVNNLRKLFLLIFLNRFRLFFRHLLRIESRRWMEHSHRRLQSSITIFPVAGRRVLRRNHGITPLFFSRCMKRLNFIDGSLTVVSSVTVPVKFSVH